MKQPLGYRIIRTESNNGKYSHLSIYLHAKDDYGWRNGIASFTWQGDDGGQWYGFRAHLEAPNMDDFNAGAALIKRVNPGDNTGPQAIIARLEKIGERLARDDRHPRERFIPLCEVPDPHLRRFMDWHKHQCTVSVLASNEEHARHAMIAAWGEYIGRASWLSASDKAADFQNWINAGQPVKEDTWGRYPANEVLPVDKALALISES